MAATAPASLTEVAVAAHDGRIWVAGGLRADGTASDALFAFDPATGVVVDGADPAGTCPSLGARLDAERARPCRPATWATR